MKFNPKQNLRRIAAVVVVGISGLALGYGLHGDNGTGCAGTRVGCTTPTFSNGATKLAFLQQPTNTNSGVAFGTQPIVAIQTAGGATVISDVSAVTLSLTVAGGATLSCTNNPRTAVSGVATFAGCSINNAGTYTLTATDGALASAVSASVTITAPGAWTPVTNANVALSPPSTFGGTGNDGSCQRLTSTPVGNLVPCASWQTAYSKAQPGDVIAVLGAPAGSTGGNINGFPGSIPAEGALYLRPDGSKTSNPVTFACGNSNAVTFSPSGSADQVVITANYVTVTGRCFFFNSRLFIGDPQNGDPNPDTNHVTIDNVRGVNFQIAGTDHTTVQNSAWGPSTECLPAGNGNLSCQNNTTTNEAYFFARGAGNCDRALNPLPSGSCGGAFYNVKIHSGFDGATSATQQPTNFVVNNNTITNFNGRDLGPTTDHDECVFLDWGGSGGGVFSNNTLTGCVIFDIFSNTQNTANVTFSGNNFSQIVNTLPSGASDYSGVTLGTPKAEIIFACRGTNLSMPNIAITNNIFANGYLLNDDQASCSPTFPNLVINNNTLNGNRYQVPTQPQP